MDVLLKGIVEYFMYQRRLDPQEHSVDVYQSWFDLCEHFEGQK